jgi:cyanophycinase
MALRGLPLGIGVGEDTAAILRGDALEVVGRGGVLLVELDPAVDLREQAPLTLRDVRVALLAGGDQADLRSGVVTPSARKQGTPALDPLAPGFKPYYPDVPFYLDVLGANAVRDAMTRLLDSPATEVRGLAFDPLADSDDPHASLGFEFRLRKSAQARGWYAGAGDEESYTIVGVRLDVTPVRVARPLYGAWTP